MKFNREKSIPDDIPHILGEPLYIWEDLLSFKPDPEKQNRFLVFMVGVLLTPITLIGALLGFVKAFERLEIYLGRVPRFYPMRPVVRAMMVAGAILLWIGLILLIFTVVNMQGYDVSDFALILGYLVINFIFSLIVFFIFHKWENDRAQMEAARNKFGSARFAEAMDLLPYTSNKGLYIGGSIYTFSDKGHVFTSAGTRGGKGTNLIIPNLLGAGGYEGSWVVIDPKGENAAITARYQKENGQDVVLLNPWNLLSEHLDESRSFNPLDILDIQSIDLVDDIQIISEMIVPISLSGGDRYFSDNARTIVSALILHIVVNMESSQRHLGTLYRLARAQGDDWLGILADMRMSENPLHKDLLDITAQEVLKLMQSGENSFGSILATVLQNTDFLKSPALQKALQSDYIPSDLSQGKSTIYVIIPADKLQSHGRWLRLVVTSTMRAVIRKPDKRVCFLLDEFAALGYLPEIETALSTYAGFNVTVWPILQSLIQLKKHYGDNWETFIANAAVRQYFNVNDNFSADYISKAIGNTTNIAKTGNWFTGTKIEANSRALATSDEVRRHSQRNIFAFISDAPPTVFGKMPYYEVEELNEKADKNPYL